MSRLLTSLTRAVRAFYAVVAALLFLVSGVAYAADTSAYKVVDGVLIYYAVLPGEMVRAYPPGSPEATMHGGVPRGQHIHHIQIALFDAESDARITDAQVTATIAEPGLPAEGIEFEPFMVGDALAYGTYYKFARLVNYTITVRLERP
ncbi:MAG: hypothetical protein ACC631_00780, partial [Halocynthiibacter sp.]